MHCKCVRATNTHTRTCMRNNQANTNVCNTLANTSACKQTSVHVHMCAQTQVCIHALANTCKQSVHAHLSPVLFGSFQITPPTLNENLTNHSSNFERACTKHSESSGTSARSPPGNTRVRILFFSFLSNKEKNKKCERFPATERVGQSRKG